ncbi:hypothetical protein RH858_08575 [Halalkaliarchaeum sp. AArc-GB]|uniref:hypothetical protein n=1 Tax=Halalkaliarchaeum sp. AArc-GB TaxID=3074078 RepID=UPI00285AFCB1|nr:hypothetical protein [Halalkaliarchaeum sp. AArc-GB]MDR5673202.1 hypothetical protein [Halalkaliarchaeum sp. AArc-GB]
MERRKFVIGMGSLAAGGAAAMGSGAFSTVEADRTVSVSTANDADAYLGLTGDDDYVTDDSGTGALTIDLGGPDNIGDGDGDGFNHDAYTLVEGVVTVENQSTADEILVGFDRGEDGENYRDVKIRLDNAGVRLSFKGWPEGYRNLAPGESAGIDVEVDTANPDSRWSYDIDASSSSEGDVTIVADEV